ncbi:MAG: DUF4783 domain-containing protein [Cyclobacteriaceae bacterium]
MKHLIIGLFMVLLAPAFAQEVFNPMKTALKAGDASALAKQFNQQIDVTLNGNQATYSKAQAEIVFRDFFRDNPPSEFSIIHTGSSKGGLQFAIGKYTSRKISYSVLMRVKETGNVRLIHEISFVKE